MVYAEIKNKRDTLVFGFPRNTADMQIKLSSIGIHKNVKDIPLSAQESDDIRVRLYAENNIWNHFVRIFSGNESLADVNEAVWAILKASFYFPLKGMLDENEYEDYYEIDNMFLMEYKGDIREAVEREQSIGDMAQYFNRSESVNEKLASAVWSVDEVGGKLYGRVNVRLKEPLTEGETEILKEWISGQNSDGLGEGFEQRAIETEEGDLYVSFWNSGDGYFVYSQDEMDAYICQQHEMRMGGM